MGVLPNFPLLLTEWAPAFGASGGLPPNQYVDLSPRTFDGTSFKKGKQYELDTIQAAELTTSLTNLDAALDPTNTAGPFGGSIEPFQGFRVRAQYPATQNLLPQAVASAGEGWSVGTIPASFGIYSGTDPTNLGQIVTPSDGAYQGTNAFQFHVPAGATAAAWNYIGSYVAVSTIPGQRYTFQIRARNVTASTTMQVIPALGWLSPTGGYNVSSSSTGTAVTLTGATTGAAWVYMTVSGIAPANACGVVVGISVYASPAAACDIQTDVWQAEWAASATTWTYPGTWYPWFAGFVERWPSSWKASGSYGYVSPTVTDAFALFSQGQLADPLTEEIKALSPRFLYRLDDPSSASQAAEASNSYPPLNVVSGKYGTGTVTFGSSIAAADPVNGIFATGGATGSACVGFSPPSPANITTSTGASVLSLTESGIVGPASMALYSRILAFRWTGTSVPANAECLWTSLDNTANGAAGLQLQINPSGVGNGGWVSFGISVTTPGVAGSVTNGPFAVAPVNFTPFDGNWHFVAFGYNDSTQSGFLSCDGFTTGMTQSLGAVPGPYTGSWTPKVAIDSLGGYLSATGEAITEFQGEIAYAAEFPTNLTAAQIQSLYSAWRNACAGESSPARYARILRYSGYTGAAVYQGGLSNMGPATDLSGSDALTCLNNVMVTENGTHFVDASGTIRFQGRDFRYNPGTPAYVFGENAAAGEWPYEDLKLDFDSTHLANDVAVTQNSTGQAFFATSATTQKAFFDRTMTRTVNTATSAEAQDCASYLLYRYQKPLTRVVSLKLNPAALANFWPIALSIELGQLIQINRRPFGCPVISLLMWVEQLQWGLDDKGGATLTLQCSPVDPTPVAQFAVWQANMYQSAAAGTNFIVVNNATDMVNPLDAQLAPGQSFVIHTSGSFGFENLTIKSVQSTGSNWTTGQITFTTNLVNTHPAAASVSENANGISNLHLYDANAVFDSVVFTY